MRIKLLLLLVLVLLIAPTAFSLNCGPYGAGTITKNMCELVGQFRTYLGVSIAILIIISALLYLLGQAFGAETRARAILLSQNLLVVILISAIIYVVFNEQTLENLLAGKFPAQYANQILIALAFGVICVILFYFPGYILQHPPLQAAAKEELSALIISVLILISWFFTNQLFTNITNSLVTLGSGLSSNASNAHLDIAYGTLEIFFVKLRTQYTHLYLFEVLIGFLSTVSFPFGTFFPGTNVLSFSLMPYDGLVLLSNAHTVVVESIGYLMATVWAKQFIILFAKDAVPTILLPFGLIMRAFPWYRSTGSSLIALCIAVYFVYPLTVMFSNYLIFDIFHPSQFVFAPTEDAISPFDPGQSDQQRKDRVNNMQKAANSESKEFLDQFSKDNHAITPKQSDKCRFIPDKLDFLCSASNWITGAVKILASTAETAFKIWKTMISFTGDWVKLIISGGLSTSVSGLYQFVLEEVISFSQLIVLMVITSVIEIIITITMYRNIAEIIGGELEILGLTKII